MSNNTEFWSVFRFHIKGDTSDWENPHVDLAIIDIILRPIILRNMDRINLWRFHRRYKPNEHYFEFSVFADVETAQMIKTDILNTGFTKELTDHHLLLNFEWMQESKDKGELLFGIGDWSESGPDEFKYSWALYAKGFSDVLMNTIHDVKSAKYSSISLNTFEEIIILYRNIHTDIEQYWYKHGVHSYFHHVHLLYGNFPGRCLISAKPIEQFNGLTGYELVDIRGYKKKGE